MQEGFDTLAGAASVYGGLFLRDFFGFYPYLASVSSSFFRSKNSCLHGIGMAYQGTVRL